MKRPWQAPGVLTPQAEILAVVFLNPDVRGRVREDVLQALYESGGNLADALTVLVDRGLTDAQIWQGGWLDLYPFEFRRAMIEGLAGLRAQHKALRRAAAAARRQRQRAPKLSDPESAIAQAIAGLDRDKTEITQATVAQRIADDHRELWGYAVNTLRRDLERNALPPVADPAWRARRGK